MGVTAGTVQAGVKSVQRGSIWSGSATSGTAPEMLYVDITISAVNVAKARVNVFAMVAGGASGAAADSVAHKNDRYQTAASVICEAFGYLLNATTVRIYGGQVTGPGYRWNGRWEVVEDY